MAQGFTSAKRWLGDLNGDTVGTILSTASDVAMIVSSDSPYIIKDLSTGNSDLRDEVGGGWIGKPWLDLVTVESRPKIAEIIDDAAAGRPQRWRHINHLTAQSESLPVLYSAVRLSAKGRIAVMGRSLKPMAELQQQLLSAQQGLERELARVRTGNARYRLLFQVADEGVMIVNAASYRVTDVNPAACHLLEQPAGSLIGQPLTDTFDTTSGQALEALFSGVRASGRANEALVRRQMGGPTLRAAVSLFREEEQQYLLLRLAPPVPTGSAGDVGRRSRVMELVEHNPDGFVVTATDGRILYANRAFLDIAELATAEQAVGEMLERWLGRVGVDFPLLTAHLREHHSIRLFATKIRGEFGGSVDVEISAVAIPDGEIPCLGFNIRDVRQRVTVERGVARQRPRTVEQLTELVGRVPLKELVRDSSDMIERLCIEAALELTSDNRAAAAEILGLSRQSLYAKLRRYGLGDLGTAGSGSDAAEQ